MVHLLLNHHLPHTVLRMVMKRNYQVVNPQVGLQDRNQLLRKHVCHNNPREAHLELGAIAPPWSNPEVAALMQLLRGAPKRLLARTRR